MGTGGGTGEAQKEAEADTEEEAGEEPGPTLAFVLTSSATLLMTPVRERSGEQEGGRDEGECVRWARVACPF